MFAVNAHRIARRALLACCLQLAFAVTAASAAAPRPITVATVSSPSSGQCTTTATLDWKRSMRRYLSVRFTFLVDGASAGGEEFSLADIRRGPLTADSTPTIAVGQTFRVEARFEPDGPTAESSEVTC